jgi:hypothetical protein
VQLRKLPLQVVPQGPTRVDAEVPRGTVIETDPPAGTEVRRLHAVTLTVSLGTVSDWIQAYIDGPSNHVNEVELPPGKHQLDRPLRIRRQGTKIRRQGKFGEDRAELIAPEGQPVFDFAYAGPVPDARASVIWSDEPDVEITS